MEFKLQAIHNNIDDNNLTGLYKSNFDEDKSSENQEVLQHTCKKNVPVLFSTTCGVHLRTFDRNSRDYKISFCDVERWVDKAFFCKMFIYIKLKYFLEFPEKSHRISRTNIFIIGVKLIKKIFKPQSY